MDVPVNPERLYRSGTDGNGENGATGRIQRAR